MLSWLIKIDMNIYDNDYEGRIILILWLKYLYLWIPFKSKDENKTLRFQELKCFRNKTKKYCMHVSRNMKPT